MKIKNLLASSLVFITILLPEYALSQPAGEESLYQDARSNYYNLKESAAKRKFRHNWINAAEKYKKVVARFPKGGRADESIYMAAKIYIELYPYSNIKEDLVEANELLAELAQEHGSSPLADDALFMAAENYEKLGDKASAYKSYHEISSTYSSGDRVNDARIRLKKLKAYATVEDGGAAKEKAVSPSSDLSEKNGNRALVTGLRHWSNPNYTRIVIDLEGSAKYKSHLLRRDPGLGKPPRLYIDLFGTRRASSLQEEVPIHDGLLKRARAAQYDQDTVRVVLDIESIKEYKIYPMPGPFRVIIDVYGEDVIKAPTIESLLPADKESGGLADSARKEELALSRQLGLGIRKIVLDPGHGGKDPGAVGPKGTKEKDVNLKVAMLLKERLEKDNYKVILTRSDDRYLDLPARTAIANMENADLFVSIHANASRNRKAYGIETYVMNAKASDRYAEEVAARENAVTSNSMGEFGSVLEEILVDMQKTNKINESGKLASSLQDSMNSGLSANYGGIKDLGVKKAPFYVLIGANMPSVLVETGFISNYKEEGRLRNSKYLGNLSGAMAKGIDRYADFVKRN